MNTLDQLKNKLNFYAAEMFPYTKKKLSLVLDDFDNSIYAPPVIKFINSMIQRYPNEVVQRSFAPKKSGARTNQEQYLVATEQDLFCPAGSLFFKIKLNGDVVPCNKYGSQNFKIGNLKRKNLSFFTQLIPCAKLNGPGCIANWNDNYPV